LRFQPWHTLIFIAVLTLLSGWIDLPGTTLNVFGLKDNIYVHEGLDLQGGLQVVLEARPPNGKAPSADALAGNKNIIERRINSLGVSEPIIQTRGSNQIIVELPGVTDPEAAVRTLRETALLEIIDTQGQVLPAGTLVQTTTGNPADVNAQAQGEGTATPGAEATPVATPEATPAAGTTGQEQPQGPVYQTIITGADLKDAFPTTDQFGTLVVGFQLNDQGAQKFFNYTSTHVGQPMSIVIDKRVISSPQINAAIRDSGIIEGMSADEVNRLALQLKSGALAVPMAVVQSRTVGPTLGQDSIDKSIVAGIAGLSIVALFMILFYRLPGVLSVVALLIYTTVVFAVFKVVGVVLTLAGIAGFILSIGMAVDAIVLIFSRLKEDLRMGHPIRRAIEAGFDHAWPSIRDSNISTMITCAILYWFGNYVGASIIQGFALTLFFGVAVSMFTAIIVTRTLLRLMLNSHWIHNQWWFGVESTPLQPAGRPAGD
jgi:preprotein translocase subunit SecD